MPGDWSSQVPAHDRPVADQTLLKLVNTNYAGTNSADDGPYPEVALVGSEVPEPNANLLLCDGLILFALTSGRLSNLKTEDLVQRLSCLSAFISELEHGN
jgi:hypothetical protein